MITLADLNIQVPYGATGEVRTTCPKCKNNCLSVKVNDGIWYCHYCGWKGGLRCRHNGHIAPQPAIVAPNQSAQRSIERVWQETRPIKEGDPVHRYILQQRGLTFDALADLPNGLRYHPNLAYHHDDNHWTHHPAMIASVSNPHGEMVSIHRTYLTQTGCKADVSSPKKLMPPAIRGAIKGGAVRLYPTETTLGIAEGIETALAIRLAIGLPVWATVSAIGMAALVLPEGVRTLIIFADNDKTETGYKSAKALARRMLKEGRAVKILLPNEVGQDWADVVAQEAQYG